MHMEPVEFVNCSEIRMGSPFVTCGVRLHLDWAPDLPTTGYQDLSAQSPDGRYLALVQWHVRANEPGFVVHTVDTVRHTVSASEPQEGCCERLWWDDGVHWSVSRIDA
jgi:hypothetical protein